MISKNSMSNKDLVRKGKQFLIHDLLSDYMKKQMEIVAMGKKELMNHWNQ